MAELTTKSYAQEVVPDISRAIQEALKYTAPWKVSDNDGIPAALYKILPTAHKYLEQHIAKVLSNEYKLIREDVQANLILLHKSGDITGPKNYRSISLLNTGYKILTYVIHIIRHS